MHFRFGVAVFVLLAFFNACVCVQPTATASSIPPDGKTDGGGEPLGVIQNVSAAVAGGHEEQIIDLTLESSSGDESATLAAMNVSGRAASRERREERDERWSDDERAGVESSVRSPQAERESRVSR